MQTTTVPQTTAKTYLTLANTRAVSVRVEGTDPKTTPSVLVTRRPSGTWEAWHSDELHGFTSGSFRLCVMYARRAAIRRHAQTVTR
ncbi:hypothetical protein C1I63_18995 [Rathayibacter caricis DSM 15933]|uniref:Uncharacterized protein n=1 Tax=Rathayibacter caricis DSM 15933 TaxID=1328867 RepID=A0A2T4UP79_9MICO|nr:hypothetical protein [Rathayibacter caricis]PTL71311.1 hypothetical protein C1I63_18995 [Rathayibacter caricis DSM 15933]